MRDIRLSATIVLLGLVMLAIACSSSGALDDPLTDGQGTLTVRVHDQAAPGITEAWITFVAVQAVGVAGNFEDVQGVALNTPVNMAELTGGQDVMLAAGTLPAGEYGGLRLSLSAITLRLDDGTDVDVLRGSFGVEVQVAIGFSVVEGQDTALGVDFPMSAFELDGGNWTFDPTRVTTD
jgi:hypothetical protein